MSISYNPFTHSLTHTCAISTHTCPGYVKMVKSWLNLSLMSAAQEERQQRLQEIEANRQDRMSRRRQQRFHQTQNFYKSLQLLQAGKLLREGADGAAEGVAEDGTPFEDYSIFLYRQQAPIFNDRVKELERKLLFPVSNQDQSIGSIHSNCLAACRRKCCTLRLRFPSISFVVCHSLSTLLTMWNPNLILDSLAVNLLLCKRKEMCRFG